MVLTLKGAMVHVFSAAFLKHYTDRRSKLLFFHQIVFVQKSFSNIGLTKTVHRKVLKTRNFKKINNNKIRRSSYNGMRK